MSDCIEWQGGRNRDGYGQVMYGGKKASVHRLALACDLGVPIEELSGKCVLHSCDNPACYNPTHLRLGTVADNMRDRAERGRHRTQGRKPVSAEEVARMKQLHRSGMLMKDIAELVGCSRPTVTRVLRGDLELKHPRT